MTRQRPITLGEIIEAQAYVAQWCWGMTWGLALMNASALMQLDPLRRPAVDRARSWGEYSREADPRDRRHCRD